MSESDPPQTEESKTIKSDDKKDIEVEEREKILNAENEEKLVVESTEDKKPKEIKEGMEVKPKKIPIGGIQMPGFFTRSKSKEHCKEDDQTEGTELIEQESKNESAPIQTKIKLPSLFKKPKGVGDSEEGEKVTDQKDKRKLLETIRLPLVSVFQLMKKNPDTQNLTNQNAQADLASMETLDDKSNDGKSATELKNVPLESKKDVEKQEEEELSWSQRLKTYRIAISALLIFLLLIILIVIIATRRSAPPATPPLRDGRYIETVTSCGKVEGQIEDSAVAFRGIPYARSPIGELRFKYAEPLNRMEYCWNGTFLAHNATPTCLQILGNGSVTGTEDCLTLDIVTPYVRYDNPLPVIVLIGADSFIGGSPGKMRPSARYARSRDVIFVRPNFRLGALGFLSLDILSHSDYPLTSGNYGLSDILEALRWIQLNIEHFGGDKDSVTLFGHKAGATLVTALATVSDAKKYFVRAWAASGGAIYPQKLRTESEQDNRSFLDLVGCKDADCLRRMDAKELVTAVEDTWRKPQPDLPRRDEVPDKRHQWLVLDGRILREHPGEVWAKGPLPVHLILGSTAQAGSSEKLLLKHTEWTESLVRHHVKNSRLGELNLTDEVLNMYSGTYKGLSSMVTDIRIACPLFAISSQMHNVSFYMVNQTRSGSNLADIDSDIDAILGRYEPSTPEQRRYFSAMQGLFYHFVWHGKVEHNVPGKNVLVVGQDVLPNATYSHCAYWLLKNIVLPYAALD